MRPVALLFAAIILLAVACSDDTTDAPSPSPIDTPLPTPTAPASAALRAPDPTPTITPVAATAAAVAPVQSPTSTASPVTSFAQPLTPTPAPTLAPTSTHTPSPTPVPTDTPTSTQTPSPAPTQPPTTTPTPAPTATHTAVPTATYTATATSSPVPTATETPVPTATATPTPVPTDTPTPTVDPALANHSPLLVEAVSSYPSGLDFVGDGLGAEEKNVLDWADSRLFTNLSFLASKYGPDNWPSEVKLASVQAIPLLMLSIDIQEKADGKHVVNWEVDSLDRLLDELGIYEGVCTSCYGKADYDTTDKVFDNYNPIVNDPEHGKGAVHHRLDTSDRMALRHQCVGCYRRQHRGLSSCFASH